MPTKRCEWCGETFEPVRSTARFCSASHRVYWNRDHAGERKQNTKPERERRVWTQPWQTHFVKGWLLELKQLDADLSALYRRGRVGLDAGRFSPEAVQYIGTRIDLLVKHARFFQEAAERLSR